MSKKPPGNPVVSYGQFVARRPWLVLVVSLLVVFLAGYGAKNIYFSTDYRIFFGPDNPQLAAQDELERTYTKVDTVSFIIRPDEGDVFNKRMLGLIKDLTERSGRFPILFGLIRCPTISIRGPKMTT